MRKNKSVKQAKKKYFRNGKYYANKAAFMNERDAARSANKAKAEEAAAAKIKAAEERAKKIADAIVVLAEKVAANGGNRKARRPAMLEAKAKLRELEAEQERIKAEIDKAQEQVRQFDGQPGNAEPHSSGYVDPIPGMDSVDELAKANKE